MDYSSNSNSTALMDDVEQLINAYKSISEYDDLNETEKEAIRGIQKHAGRLHDSAKTREILTEVRWDRIADNAHGMVGEINNTVGLPNNINSGDIPDDQYREMVEDVEQEVNSIIESLNRIEELSSELNEHAH